MRVMHVISGLGTGGAESFLATLAPRLRDLGIEQAVVSLTGDGPIARRLSDHAIEVIALDARGALGPPQALGGLVGLVRRRRPDVLQGWMYHGDLFAALAHKLAGSGRLFWNIRCSDMRLEDYSRQLRLVVGGCARLSRLPDVVLANSSAGAQVHSAAGYRPKELLVIPNGIDETVFRPDPETRRAIRAELGIGADELVVMNVARVDPMKDHPGLLAAADRIGGGRFVLIGKGTEALARPPAVLGLGQRQDVARLLAAGDVIVSSSAYGEGFSNAIAEGMSAGLVPVATDVGDAAEIVGDCGIVVPPRQPAALADAIGKVASMTAGARTALGLAARERVTDRFSLDRAVERFAALYRGASPAAIRAS